MLWREVWTPHTVWECSAKPEYIDCIATPRRS